LGGAIEMVSKLVAHGISVDYDSPLMNCVKNGKTLVSLGTKSKFSMLLDAKRQTTKKWYISTT